MSATLPSPYFCTSKPSPPPFASCTRTTPLLRHCQQMVLLDTYLLYGLMSTATHVCTHLGRSLELCPQLGQLCFQLSQVVLRCLQGTLDNRCHRAHHAEHGTSTVALANTVHTLFF